MGPSATSRVSVRYSQPHFHLQKLLRPWRAADIQHGGIYINDEPEREEVAAHPFGLDELGQAVKVLVAAIKTIRITIV